VYKEKEGQEREKMSPLFLPNIHELTLKLGGLKGLRILQKLFMDLEFVQ